MRIAIVLLFAFYLQASDTPDVSAEWNTLRDKASLLYQHDSFAEAEPLLIRALQMANELGDETARLTSLKELAVVYASGGKYEKAEPLFKEAVPLEEKLHGPTFVNLAVTLNYLGVSERELLHCEAAIAAHTRALDIVMQQNKPTTELLAITYQALGAAEDLRAKFAPAEQHYLKALELSSGGHGLGPIGTARVMIRLSRINAERAGFQAAEGYLKKAANLIRKNSREEGPEWIEYFDTLGTVRLYQGKYTDAEKYWRYNLSLSEKLLGPQHPKVLTMMVRLGEFYLIVSDNDKAMDILTQRIALGEKLDRDDDSEIALVLTDLGLIHTRRREYVKAGELFERSMKLLETSRPANGLYLALALTSQGEFFSAQGSWADAAKSFERAMQLRKNALGENHPLVADTMISYARALAKSNRKKEAKLYEERVREIFEGVPELAMARQTVDVRTLRAKR